MSQANDAEAALSLVVRRVVDGTPDCAFRAWTDPDQIRQWWGPAGVVCADCTVDLRVGGRYQIANRLPDDTILWIFGVFVRVEKPHLLEYTWETGLEPAYEAIGDERVTIRFVAAGAQTEVIVEHTRCLDEQVQADHQAGWLGCLDGLETFLRTTQRAPIG